MDREIDPWFILPGDTPHKEIRRKVVRLGHTSGSRTLKEAFSAAVSLGLMKAVTRLFFKLRLQHSWKASWFRR